MTADELKDKCDRLHKIGMPEIPELFWYGDGETHIPTYLEIEDNEAVPIRCVHAEAIVEQATRDFWLGKGEGLDEPYMPKRKNSIDIENGKVGVLEWSGYVGDKVGKGPTLMDAVLDAEEK